MSLPDYTDRSLWPEVIRTSGAFMAKRLSDGRWAMLSIMAFDNTRLNVLAHEDELSMANFSTDPFGWVRHMSTGRRREYDANGDYREWVNP